MEKAQSYSFMFSSIDFLEFSLSHLGLYSPEDHLCGRDLASSSSLSLLLLLLIFEAIFLYASLFWLACGINFDVYQIHVSKLGFFPELYVVFHLTFFPFCKKSKLCLFYFNLWIYSIPWLSIRTNTPHPFFILLLKISKLVWQFLGFFFPKYIFK